MQLQSFWMKENTTPEQKSSTFCKFSIFIDTAEKLMSSFPLIDHVNQLINQEQME